MMDEPDSVAVVLDHGGSVHDCMPRHYPIEVTLAWFVALHQGMVDRWRAKMEEADEMGFAPDLANPEDEQA